MNRSYDDTRPVWSNLIRKKQTFAPGCRNPRSMTVFSFSFSTEAKEKQQCEWLDGCCARVLIPNFQVVTRDPARPVPQPDSVRLSQARQVGSTAGTSVLRSTAAVADQTYRRNRVTFGGAEVPPIDFMGVWAQFWKLSRKPRQTFR
ncbi:hypothetical protein MCOR03_005485 [Pyricularia oryzae]|nr:hypothetical protein MCOR01_008299 [Pyricularia oryzae]KAI6294377.1 hypothetical protein MCOR33_008492 [Pyricularia grisea]KAI6265217.1 hypothetical protein MCOR26_010855 [Pyricularia oryzae]KAI6407583.1 hypothetical protein MCOR24_007530 [Pyricularia oryzae]KAI6408307.1 hypothetical protein MCOR23_001441 [Pyricularia oryzae]